MLATSVGARYDRAAVEIRATRIVLRPWRKADEVALVREANDREVWRNLRDRFPHPYTAADARAWIGGCETAGVTMHFAIALDDVPVGGIGLDRRTDVHRQNAEVGYWLGRAFRGRGLATEALRAIVPYAFDELAIERLEAGVFEWNPASCRVLEKAGFRFEGRLRRRAVKDGHVLDELLYARLRGE